MRSRSIEILRNEEILQSFSVLIDKREQDTERARKRYEAFSVPYNRATLDYGDYTYNVVIDGEKLHRSDMRVNGLCVVERKQNLDELAACFTRGRERFEREFQRAGDYNAKVYLLVENASLDLLMAGQYRSKFRPKAFLASLMAFEVRYNITTLFCESKNSGALIKEVLYRDIKERLERGEFG